MSSLLQFQQALSEIPELQTCNVFLLYTFCRISTEHQCLSQYRPSSAVYTFPVSPVFQFSSSKNWKGGVFQFSCSHFSSFPVFQFQFCDVTFPVFAAGVRTGKRENWKTGSGFPVLANRIISISKPENIQGFHFA